MSVDRRNGAKAKQPFNRADDDDLQLPRGKLGSGRRRQNEHPYSEGSYRNNGRAGYNTDYRKGTGLGSGRYGSPRYGNPIDYEDYETNPYDYMHSRYPGYNPLFGDMDMATYAEALGNQGGGSRRRPSLADNVFDTEDLEGEDAYPSEEGMASHWVKEISYRYFSDADNKALLRWIMIFFNNCLENGAL